MMEFLPMMTKRSLAPKRPIDNIVFKDRQERMIFFNKRRDCWNDFINGTSKFKFAEMKDSFDVRCSNCISEFNSVCLLHLRKMETDENPCKEWSLKVLR
jgi:hypothetical protein